MFIQVAPIARHMADKATEEIVFVDCLKCSGFHFDLSYIEPSGDATNYGGHGFLQENVRTGLQPVLVERAFG